MQIDASRLNAKAIRSLTLSLESALVQFMLLIGITFSASPAPAIGIPMFSNALFVMTISTGMNLLRLASLAPSDMSTPLSKINASQPLPFAQEVKFTTL